MDHLSFIFRLFGAADAVHLPLWLQGGWAVDARLGRATREHGDVDVAYPSDREGEFLEILRNLGGGALKPTGYGFLMEVGEVLVDAEPCEKTDGGYELPGLPEGSCPPEAQGTLDGVALRCVSWEALLWDYFHYMGEVPWQDWPEKDVRAYALVRDTYGPEETDQLRRQFEQKTE